MPRLARRQMAAHGANGAALTCGPCIWHRWPDVITALAGLAGQSEEVREAARVDGATGLGLFRDITLPLLGP